MWTLPSRRWIPVLFSLWILGGAAALAEVRVSGELRLWHDVTLTIDGPQASETDEENPFLDYRLQVTFQQGDHRYVVPGFFAADGDAAESGAAAGNQWRVHFSPDRTGTWEYHVSLRKGDQIALSDDPTAGEPAEGDGQSGPFTILPTDKTGRDFRAQGRLAYVGARYRKFLGSEQWFLKAGADSPENFLGYADFDGTRSLRPGNPLHHYQPHQQDWRQGDPAWHGDRGRGIIGALNYLADQGGNSVYFLTMNVEGDGRDVWPWIQPDRRDRFDCGKLDQWEIVFSHMDRLGLMLHMVTQETENDQLLDGGRLGVERKLYYRELIARFGHHLAITWNLGEENTNTPEERLAFARYIRDLDPYDHLIVIHTFPGKYDEVYRPLLGQTCIDGVSLQTNDTKRQTEKWIRQSHSRGRDWVVTLDEIGPANTGVVPDADDADHDQVRREHLWPHLMAGGAGVEWYFGYSYPDNDLNCEDWRSRERLWQMTTRATSFFQRYLPFTEMQGEDTLVDARDALCFAKPGSVYAVYLPHGGTTRLNFGAACGQFKIFWFDPRSGGDLQTGSVLSVEGLGWQDLGAPPSDEEKDWVVLVKR